MQADAVSYSQVTTSHSIFYTKIHLLCTYLGAEILGQIRVKKNAYY